MRIDGCTALITGATAGIGREFACQLGGRAATLVLVARRKARLEELRGELLERHRALRVEIRPTDLSRRAPVDELIAWADGQEAAIDLLINNAGLGDMGAFSTADPERVDQMMQVNMVALTRLTRALLPAMIKQKRGAILNVSSSASFLPIPNFAVYAATKAYVTSFTEALRGELHGTGIHLSALCPGPTHSEFSDVADSHSPTLERMKMPAAPVVAAGLDGLDRNKAVVIPGFKNKVGAQMSRLLPRSTMRNIIGRIKV